MKSGTIDFPISRSRNHFQFEEPIFILIAFGALLSTLSMYLWYKLKQKLDLLQRSLESEKCCIIHSVSTFSQMCNEEPCFSHTIQLLYNNFNYSFTLSTISLNASSIRNYSRQSVNINTECHNHPSQEDPSHYQSGETSSVLKATSLQHWFKNWQEERKHKLTASTFAGAIGFFPKRRVQLWLEKLGTIEPFSGNLATCWSNIKEEKALERYKLITGNTVLFPKFQVYGNQNPQDDWLAASPDGVVDRIVYGLPDRGVLEIKCPYFDGDMSRAAPWKRIPLFHIPQAQGLMEILDRDWMDLYMWTPNGSSLFRLYRDVEYWDVLKMALSDFWWKHVQPAKEICSTSVITNPLTQLRQFKPAPRHELCRYIVVDSRRVIDSSKLLIREIHGVLQMH